jgi:hypothetical protein
MLSLTCTSTNTVHRTALHCFALQCTALHCTNAVIAMHRHQYSALHCTALQCCRHVQAPICPRLASPPKFYPSRPPRLALLALLSLPNKTLGLPLYLLSMADSNTVGKKYTVARSPSSETTLETTGKRRGAECIYMWRRIPSQAPDKAKWSSEWRRDPFRPKWVRFCSVSVRTLQGAALGCSVHSVQEGCGSLLIGAEHCGGDASVRHLCSGSSSLCSVCSSLCSVCSSVCSVSSSLCVANRLAAEMHHRGNCLHDSDSADTVIAHPLRATAMHRCNSLQYSALACSDVQFCAKLFGASATYGKVHK